VYPIALWEGVRLVAWRSDGGVSRGWERETDRFWSCISLVWSKNGIDGGETQPSLPYLLRLGEPTGPEALHMAFILSEGADR
jgi:hypothetical protein